MKEKRADVGLSNNNSWLSLWLERQGRIHCGWNFDFIILNSESVPPPQNKSWEWGIIVGRVYEQGSERLD